jgi:hypothetical protein
MKKLKAIVRLDFQIATQVKYTYAWLEVVFEQYTWSQRANDSLQIAS